METRFYKEFGSFVDVTDGARRHPLAPDQMRFAKVHSFNKSLININKSICVFGQSILFHSKNEGHLFMLYLVKYVVL